MIRLYSLRKVDAILKDLSPLADRAAADYGIPAACIRAMLYRETKEIDLFDVAADTAVLLGLFGRDDCSTGYAQIFSRVAIRALGFAEENGIERASRFGFDRALSDRDPADVRAVWLRLYRDREFNLRMGTLNLLAAAQEAVGSFDYAGLSPEEMKRAFSRYNANTRTVTAYGEEVFEYYLRFQNAR